METHLDDRSVQAVERPMVLDRSFEKQARVRFDIHRSHHCGDLDVRREVYVPAVGIVPLEKPLAHGDIYSAINSATTTYSKHAKNRSRPTCLEGHSGMLFGKGSGPEVLITSSMPFSDGMM